MSKRSKLLLAIRNNPKDVRFSDLQRLVLALDFELARVEGSHHIYAHVRTEIPPVNLQEGKGGKAKPYQVEQVLGLIDRFNLEP